MTYVHAQMSYRNTKHKDFVDKKMSHEFSDSRRQNTLPAQNDKKAKNPQPEVPGQPNVGNTSPELNCQEIQNDLHFF